MDKTDFQNRVLSCEQMLYRISKTICFNDSDCEDAVQSAIMKAWASLKKLRNEEYFRSWLVRILINECYNINKKCKRTTEFEEYMESNSYDVDAYSDVYEAIVKLPEKIRLTVELHYIEDYTVEETAEILKIPVGTVKSRLSSGRNILRTLLEDS